MAKEGPSQRICVTVAVVLLLLIAPNSFATAPQQDQGGLELFDAALAKFEADREALRSWQYHQTLTTHQFDSRGNVVAKGTWRSIVRPGDPKPLEYTAAHVEGKLSFFKASSEEQGVNSSPAQRPSRPEHEDKNQAEAAIDAVKKYNLRTRYLWKRAGDETIGGETASVLTFSPKPKQNTSTREERFFAQLGGRLWISQSDYTVLKAEASLQAPAHLFWVIARVTTFNVSYTLRPDTGAGRLLRKSRATAETVVTFPFYAVRQRHSLTVNKFEPRT
jgi:hypothetical protein